MFRRLLNKKAYLLLFFKFCLVNGVSCVIVHVNINMV